MSWKVLCSLICSKTGIFYSYIVGPESLKLIIWYEGSIYLSPGDKVQPTHNGILINGSFHSITIYNISPYSQTLWNALKNTLVCPLNKDKKQMICCYSGKCNVRICPYGFLTNPLLP